MTRALHRPSAPLSWLVAAALSFLSTPAASGQETCDPAVRLSDASPPLCELAHLVRATRTDAAVVLHRG
jgi:hypothetical protein